MTIDALAQSLAALLDISMESAYMLLGGVLGWLIGRYVKFGASATPIELSASAGVTKPSTLLRRQPLTTVTLNSVNLNGGGDNSTMTLDPAVLAEVQSLLQANRKIDAIKCVREASGLDLVVAKMMVEALEKTMR